MAGDGQEQQRERAVRVAATRVWKKGAAQETQSDPLVQKLCLLLGKRRAWHSILAARTALLQGQRAGIAVEDAVIIEQHGPRSYLQV